MGSRSPKRVVVLFDVMSEPPQDHDYSDLYKDVSFESEKAVADSLKRLGYEAIFIGVFDDLPRLMSDLKRIRPDFIFNLTESFSGKRELAPQLASVFDLLRIPYTGTRALGLQLAQDKNLAKKILVHHRVRVPRWIASSFRRPLKAVKNFQFPAFVKPAREESSEGIARKSFVENEKDCLDRVHFLHEKFSADVIIEEFIVGRELYVSVLGNRRLQVFPVREITFKEFPEDMPQFATYKVKWDEEYRKKYGIKNDFAKNLSDEVLKQIDAVTKRSYEALHLQGFARFDLRLTDKGEIVFLEANPNPSLSPWDDFAKSATKAEIAYDQLIQKIVDLAL